MSVGRLGVIVVVAAGLGACLDPQVVTCSDGTVCPSGTVCDPLGGACVDPAGLTVPTAGLDFGEVACGATPTLPVSVANYGQASVDIRAYATSGDLVVTPANTTITPGQVVELEVQPALVRAPGPITASVVVASNQQLIEVPVTLVSTGAVVTLDRTVVDFGDQTVGQRGDLALRLGNDGNRAVEVVPSVSAGPFRLVSSSPVLIEPGGQQTVGLSYQPSAAGTSTAELSLSYLGVLCARAPMTIGLQGMGDSTGVLLDQTTLDFGSAACGAGSATKSVTVTNNLGVPVALAARVEGPDAARYAAPALSAVAIPAGGRVTIAVTHLPVPATLPLPLTDEVATLVVDVTTGTAVVSKQVQLARALRAPYLEVTPPALDFGTVPTGTVSVLGVTMSNKGNAVGAVAMPALPAAGLRVTPASFSLGPGGAQSLSVSLTPTGSNVVAFDGLMISLGAPGDCSGGAGVEVSAVAGGEPF